jgi:pyruvate dehydrogenase E2 component (dihydrolipoamide acetyltransferase)
VPAIGRVFASPIVRKLAGERGVDLAGLAGSGPNGRITRRDLERFLAAGTANPTPTPGAAVTPAPGRSAGASAVPGLTAAPSAPLAEATVSGGAGQEPVLDEGGALPAASPGGTTPADGTLIPHTPMRRAIARRLAESKATVPHFYMTADRSWTNCSRCASGSMNRRR